MELVQIILCCIGGFALIGFIIGLVKGFTKVKSWANEYVIATAVTIPLSTQVVDKIDMTGVEETVAKILPACVVLVLAVIALLLVMLISHIVRAGLNKGIAHHRQLVGYKQTEKQKEHNEEILDALYSKDKTKYNKLAKRKYRQGGGGFGFLNRLFGGITLAIKAATVVSLIAVIVFAFTDMLNIAALPEYIQNLYSSKLWVFIKPYIFDTVVIGLIFVCIRSGFSGGITSVLWKLVVLALVCGAAFGAYYLVFMSGAFDSASTAFDANVVSGWFANVDLGEYEVNTYGLAQLIITAGVFVLFLIVVIILAIFVPKFIYTARESATYRVIDGILGAIVAVAVMLAVLYFVGGLLLTAHDLSFMEQFNGYFEGSGVAKYIYTENLLMHFKLMPINISDWLK